jgi:hypothetical protein
MNFFIWRGIGAFIICNVGENMLPWGELIARFFVGMSMKATARYNTLVKQLRWARTTATGLKSP